MSREWTQVTKHSPCPACGKPDWCAWGKSGMLKCQRSEVAPDGMRFVSRTDDEGFMFAPADATGRPQARRPRWGDAASKAVQEPKTAPKSFQTVEEAIAVYERSLGTPSASWDYHDEGGNVVFKALRFFVAPDPDKPMGKPDKTFRPVSLVDGKWIPADPPGKLKLYGLPALLTAPNPSQIVVVEGEKTADCARRLGWTVTTSAHGSKCPAKSDWTPVAGHRLTVMVDNDADGETYGRSVTALAYAAGAAEVRVVRLRDLWNEIPTGGDIVDYLAHRGDDAAAKADIEALIARTPPVPVPRPDSIPASKERGLARMEFDPVPLGSLGPSVPPEWVWEGFIAKGHVTLFTGLWKAGKSTLVSWLVHDVRYGGGLVKQPLGLKTLIISEESKTLWCRRRDDLELDDDIHVLLRPFKSKPSNHEWESLVARIIELVSQRGYGLVALDTLGALWPVENENDASEVGAALQPLLTLAETGVAVLVIHHPKKGDSAEGQASRGSGALPSSVDIIVELRRHRAEDPRDRRRVLKSYSRFDETPPETVLELTESGYVVIGDCAVASRKDRLDTIEKLLPSGSEGMTVDEMLAGWPTKPAPGKRSVADDLQCGTTERGWVKSGEGKRGHPFRFQRAPGFDSGKTPLLSARNETNSPIADKPAARPGRRQKSQADGQTKGDSR